MHFFEAGDPLAGGAPDSGLTDTTYGEPGSYTGTEGQDQGPGGGVE